MICINFIYFEQEPLWSRSCTPAATNSWNVTKDEPASNALLKPLPAIPERTKSP